MKKVIILSAVLCLFTYSVTEAQINKGKILIGVGTSFSYYNFGSDLFSLGFSTIKQKSNSPETLDPSTQKMTTLNLLPKFGYFIANNLVLGADICIASATSKTSSGQYVDKYTSSSLGIGPFIRYYFNGSKVMPFLEVQSLFGSIREKSEYGTNKSTYKTGMTSFGGGAGIAVKAGDRLTFDMLAGYNSMSTKDKENNPDNERTVQGTLGFKLGFTVILGAK